MINIGLDLVPSKLIVGIPKDPRKNNQIFRLVVRANVCSILILAATNVQNGVSPRYILVSVIHTG